MKKNILTIAFSLLLVACGHSEKSSESGSASSDGTQSTVATVSRDFNADSAYAYVSRQVNFGPRVPGSESHSACATYLISTLESFGAVVEEQTGEMTLYDGRRMPVRNLVARINPEAKRRVLLSSHWDSRPFSDQEKDETLWKKPIPGANDGASGVGVLLEIARQLQGVELTIGVDIVFFDLEDWGTPEFYEGNAAADSYCLGSQLWAKQKGYGAIKPEAGILLDMVGAPGARFYKEQVSDYFAPQVLHAVWHQAQLLGFENYFVSQTGGAVTDDHLYLNKLAGIPTIDIIQFDTSTDTGFGAYWHTQADSMQAIDRTTLFVVGQTVLHYLLNYK